LEFIRVNLCFIRGFPLTSRLRQIIFPGLL
jgi:hypothetical protein